MPRSESIDRRGGSQGGRAWHLPVPSTIHQVPVDLEGEGDMVTIALRLEQSPEKTADLPTPPSRKVEEEFDGGDAAGPDPRPKTRPTVATIRDTGGL